MASRYNRRARVQRHNRLFEALEQRQLLATILWDGDGDGVTLNQAANWDGDVLPGAADDAVVNIPASPALVMSSGSLTVGSLNIDEDLTMSGGTITINTGQSNFSGDFDFTGGTLTGDAEIVMQSTMNWSGGALITGGGELIIDNGAFVFNITGDAGFARRVDNEGTAVWSAGTIGGLTGQVAQVFINNGSFTVTGTAQSFEWNDGPGLFVNHGTFVKNGNTTVIFAAGFNTDNSATVSAGTLRMGGGGSLGGTVSIAAGAVIEMTPGIQFLHEPGTVAGAGLLRITGGEHHLNGNLVINSDLEILDGTFDTTGEIIINGDAALWSGGSFDATTLRVGSAGVLTMNTAAAKTVSSAMVNGGIIHHSAGALRLDSGTFTNASTGRYNLTGTATITSAGTGNVFVNDGDFVKSSAGVVTVTAQFNNTGDLIISQGTLNLDGGGVNTGRRHVAVNTTLAYHASYTHGAGSTLTGGGSGVFDGGNQVMGGDWTTRAYLKMASGNLTGTGTLTNTGVLQWMGGTINGTGDLLISAGKMTIITPGHHALGRDITNNSVLHMLNGTLSMSGATITSNAGKDMVLATGGTVTNTAGTNAITNAGSLRKLGAGELTLASGITFSNTGFLDVRNGALHVTGPAAQVSANTLTAGSWQVLPTGELTLGATSIRTIGAGATVTLLGGVASFGTLAGLNRVDGTLNLGLNGFYNVTPVGGTFTNNGVIDLGRGRDLRITGNYTQTAAGRLNIDVGGAAGHLFSSVTATGVATFGGTLGLDYVNGYSPAAGVVLNFFTSGSRSGQFGTLDIDPLAGRTTSIQYFATGARAVVSAP